MTGLWPDLVMLGAGLCLVYGLGVARTGLELACAAGLAFLAGVAATSLLLIAAMALGAPFTLGVFVAAALVVSAAGLLGARRSRPVARRDDLRIGKLGAVVSAAAGALALALTGSGLVTARSHPLHTWDAWSIWSRKAEMLAATGTLDASFFGNPHYAFMGADYPLLLPVVYGLQYRAGGVDTQLVHVQAWLLLAAFAGAAAFVARRWLRNPVWAVAPAAILVLPGIYNQALTGYADVPMAVFLGMGALILGIWLHDGTRPQLALAGLLLAGAASTKREGLFGAVVCLAAAGAVLATTRSWPRLRELSVASVLAGVALSPWWLWLGHNGIHGNLSVSSGADPSYLADRADRVAPAAQALVRQLSAGDRWAFLVPLALALCIFALVLRGRRPVAAFYLLCITGFFVALVWAYWTAPTEIEWHIGTSADRLVTGAVLLAFAALLHLTSSGLTDERRRPSG